MAARAERVTWEGVELDPHYRFRTETIIELLGITPRSRNRSSNVDLDEVSKLATRDKLGPNSRF